MVSGRDGDVHFHHSQPPSVEPGFSPSTLEIIINEADEDSAAHWTGNQKIRGLLIQRLCDFG